MFGFFRTWYGAGLMSVLTMVFLLSLAHWVSGWGAGPILFLWIVMQASLYSRNHTLGRETPRWYMGTNLAGIAFGVMVLVLVSGSSLVTPAPTLQPVTTRIPVFDPTHCANMSTRVLSCTPLPGLSNAMQPADGVPDGLTLCYSPDIVRDTKTKEIITTVSVERMGSRSGSTIIAFRVKGHKVNINYQLVDFRETHGSCANVRL